MEPLEPGRLVTSTAGRDRGLPLLVYAVDPDGSVWVVDGRRRPLQRPKRKNGKHLRPLPHAARELAERWARGETVTDGEVRAAIEALVGKAEEAG